MKKLSLVLAMLFAFIFVGCSGGGNDNNNIQALLDVNKKEVPLEDSPVIEKLSDSGIAYNTFLQLNNELNITVEISDDKKVADSYIWSILSQPNGSNLKLTSFNNGQSVVFTPSVAGDYSLKITDSTGNEKIDTFSIYEAIPFDENKIEGNDGSKSIDEISGTVQNQYWVTSITLSESDIKSIISKYSVFASVGYDEVNGVLVETSGLDQDINEAIKLLELEQGIFSVTKRSYTGEEVDTEFKLPDDGSDFDDLGDNWHLEFINMEEAWEVTTGNKDILVGISDAGFYTKHDDLKGKFEKKYTALKATHGTAVSGIIGANTDNEEGMSGINWISKLVVNNYKNDCKNDTSSNYANVLNYNKKVKLINSSWGCMGNHQIWKGHSPGTQILGIKKTRTFRTAAMVLSDKLHIWATGNDGANADTQNGALHLNNDGVYIELKNVIVVTALLTDGTLARYSDYGRTVDIAAPTEFKSTKTEFKSTKDDDIFFDDYYEADKADDYGTNYSGGFNGTSAAAPVVTGVASLIYSLIPEISPSDVKSILIKSSDSNVSERHIDTEGNTENFTTQENGSHPAIPILNAQAALEMTRDIKEGKIIKITHYFLNPFNPQALIRVFSGNGKLETTKVSFDIAGSLSGVNWIFLDSQSGTSSDTTIALDKNYFSYRLTGSVDLEHNNTGILSKVTFDEEFSINNIVATVKDTTTLETISGVSIKIEAMLTEELSEGIVDENGEVNLYLNKGSYKVIATKAGYKEFRKIVHVPEKSENMAIDILMTADSVDAVGTIGGIISTENGEPLKNALVRLSGGEQTNGFFASTTTDEFGTYSLSSINKKDSTGSLIKSFTLSASAKGYSEVIKEDIVILSGNSINYNFTLPKNELPETIIYSTSFEETNNAWINTGIWHIQDLKTTLIVNTLVENGFVALSPDEETAHAYLPNADDGKNSLWYGLEDTGSFILSQKDGDTLKSGGNSVSSHSGTSTSPLIDLTDAVEPVLSFRTWWEIEAVNPNANGFDIMDVKISVNEGEFTTIKRLNPEVDPIISNRADKAMSSAGVIRKPIWVPEELDLSEYIGTKIKIQFSFNTVDNLYNGFRGWFIDTLTIVDYNSQSQIVAKSISKNNSNYRKKIFDGLTEEYLRIHKRPLKYMNSEQMSRVK